MFPRVLLEEGLVHIVLGGVTDGILKIIMTLLFLKNTYPHLFRWLLSVLPRKRTFLFLLINLKKVLRRVICMSLIFLSSLSTKIGPHNIEWDHQWYAENYNDPLFIKNPIHCN